MAWTETITLMTAEARNRSNTTSDQSVSDAEILGYLNREIAKWQQLVIKTSTQDYFFTQRYFNTVAGTGAYALAGLVVPGPGGGASTDFFKLLGVSVTVNGLRFAIKPIMFVERDNYNQGVVGWQDLARVQYRLVGANIFFVPVPDAVYRVDLYGIPSPTILDTGVGGTTSMDSYASWGEYAVLGAAYKIAVKKGLNDLATLLKGEQQEVRDIIEQMAASRDVGMPERVADVVGWPED